MSHDGQIPTSLASPPNALICSSRSSLLFLFHLRFQLRFLFRSDSSIFSSPARFPCHDHASHSKKSLCMKSIPQPEDRPSFQRLLGLESATSQPRELQSRVGRAVSECCRLQSTEDESEHNYVTAAAMLFMPALCVSYNSAQRSRGTDRMNLGMNSSTGGEHWFCPFVRA